MSKLELGYLIHAALHHALQEQENLLKHERVADLLPVIQRLAHFTLELEEWYSDKYHLKDRCNYFRTEAEKIEAEADRISEQIWRYAPVSLTPIFQKIRDRQSQLSDDKSYPKQLRSQFNNFRLGLMEQVAGARLLENNSDLGEEVERILTQYLERRLGTSVRILRGGHIYDYDGNRSGQMDIIVTPGDALGFCPADTGGGKFNVMIDQVIAAISVTSRLTAAELCKRWEEFQKVPLFEEKQKSHPSLAKHGWPLCYIIGAESDDLEKLEEAWEKVASGEARHNPQMVLLLDSGYMIARTACWPTSERCRGPNSMLNTGTGIYAGLGLGWLEAQIAGRNCILTGRSPDWIERLSKQLSQLELREALPPTFDSRRDRFFIFNSPIHGVLKWGAERFYPHNRLQLNTVIVEETTLTDPNQPVTRDRFFGRYKFEPRWFNLDAVATKDDYCALEEWIDPSDFEKHRRRIVVFDSRTGDDMTSKLSRLLTNCSELEQLSPVVKGESTGNPDKA